MKYPLERFENDRLIKRLLKEESPANSCEFYEMIQQFYLDHTSTYYFPGDLCVFYPKIVEYKAKTIRLCDISGARIMPGSFYYCYRPFLENISSGRKYVLERTIHAEIGYYDFFPGTLFEFEQLAFSLANSEMVENSDYNYADLAKNMGETLRLQELHSKRKVKR